MKILFILSGNHAENNNSLTEQSILIKNAKHQGDSLIKMGYDVSYFYIKGKGFTGYLKSIPSIRRCIRQGKFDIIHAHYSLSAIAASLAIPHKMIVSLMGSDIHSSRLMQMIIKIFSRFIWNKVIVKSEQMKIKIKIDNAKVLPNGVDCTVFYPSDKIKARKELNLTLDKKIILFAADPSRKEKNYLLAKEAFIILNHNDSILLPVFNVPYSQMPVYLNAADVLLLTSLWEGSVNVVKEAMACNLAVVSTDVGDVKTNTDKLPGYYITSFVPADIAEKLKLALNNNININGLERLKFLGLDSESTNNKLIDLYKSTINN
jgi:glycosyltransferase involved in cell wall biosynthesis